MTKNKAIGYLLKLKHEFTLSDNFKNALTIGVDCIEKLQQMNDIDKIKTAISMLEEIESDRYESEVNDIYNQLEILLYNITNDLTTQDNEDYALGEYINEEVDKYRDQLYEERLRGDND